MASVVPVFLAIDARLSEHLADHSSAEIGEALVTSVVQVGQLQVVQTEQVQDGGVKVAGVDGVLHSPVADLIRGADDGAALHSASSHPHRKPIRIMVPPLPILGN